MSRRKFLKRSALGVGGILFAKYTSGSNELKGTTISQPITKPIVISTWKHGLAANKAAWKILEKRR